jgi:hypothetical protein
MKMVWFKTISEHSDTPADVAVNPAHVTHVAAYYRGPAKSEIFLSGAHDSSVIVDGLPAEVVAALEAAGNRELK